MSDTTPARPARTSRRTHWLIPTMLLPFLLGCTTSEDEPQSVSPSPSPGAELVCGIDPADVELATGYLPDRSTNDLSASDGRGTGVCDAFSREKDGELLAVELFRLDDPESVAVRQRMAGETGNLPLFVYDSQVVDGAVWGTDNIPGPQANVSANAEIFWGETHIRVYISPVAAERSGADDLLHLAYQVIDTYQLERPEPDE